MAKDFERVEAVAIERMEKLEQIEEEKEEQESSSEEEAQQRAQKIELIPSVKKEKKIKLTPSVKEEIKEEEKKEESRHPLEVPDSIINWDYYEKSRHTTDQAQLIKDCIAETQRKQKQVQEIKLRIKRELAAEAEKNADKQPQKDSFVSPDRPSMAH